MQTEQHAKKKALIFNFKKDLQVIIFVVVEVSLAENVQNIQILLIK